MMLRVETCEPLSSFGVSDGDNIGNIAGTKASTYGEVYAFQQPALLPFRFEPLYGNLRIAFVNGSTATSLADTDLR